MRGQESGSRRRAVCSMDAHVSSSTTQVPRPRPLEVRTDEGRLVPPRWLDRAPVTRALLATNVAVFLVQLVLGALSQLPDSPSLVEFVRSARPLLTHFPSSESLAFGASYTLATVGENRYETLVTACFLHDGLLHIGFNMLALWQAGPLVERSVGSARMAPMYLLAGAAGNALSVAHAWLMRSAQITIGASGAISGILGAALVVGWRVQGWRGPLTQAMVRWIILIVAFGFFANLSGGRIDNAAHVGGALAGTAIALTWRRGYRYSERATGVILGLCVGVVAACIGVVAVRDRDPFARMVLEERSDYTMYALREGRCRDAREGLLAVERLRAKMAPVTSLRNQVRTACGD